MKKASGLETNRTEQETTTERIVFELKCGGVYLLKTYSRENLKKYFQDKKVQDLAIDFMIAKTWGEKYELIVEVIMEIMLERKLFKIAN